MIEPKPTTTRVVENRSLEHSGLHTSGVDFGWRIGKCIANENRSQTGAGNGRQATGNRRQGTKISRFTNLDFCLLFPVSCSLSPVSRLLSLADSTATHGTRTRDLVLTKDVLYQLS